MLKHPRNYQRLLIALGVFLLAQGGTSAIYRPSTPAQLVTAVDSANATAVDDIIDLGGLTFAFNVPCNLAPFSDVNCTTVNGPNLLPPIKNSNTSGRLSIINGKIMRNTTVSGVPNTAVARIIELQSDADLTLDDVTLLNGNLIPLTMLHNTADEHAFIPVTNADQGGAIFNNGGLAVQNSTISFNTANDSGGGIYNTSGADLFIQSSNISNNYAANVSANGTTGSVGGGGGIFNAGFIFGIIASSVSHNITPGYGAGINNQGGVNIFDSTIAYNFACTSVLGGQCPAGEPTASGGGIYNDGCAFALYVTNSTINNNLAYQGGGIYNNSNGSGCEFGIRDSFFPDVGDNTFIHNTTIVQNTASEGGGGIYNNDNNDVLGGNATIAELVSTIIANNIDNDEIVEASPDVENRGTITLENHNLIGNNSNAGLGFTFVNGVNFDIVGTAAAPVDPLLLAIAAHDGINLVFVPVAGSPAINNGDNSYFLPRDQREEPRVACGLPDIGSVELEMCF